MLELLLVRPGTTDFDLEGRILGTLDVPLNKEADPEIATMVREFSGQSIDAVYSSPSQSSVQTAEHICNALSIKRKQLNRLINLNMGLWQGMLVEEVKRKQPKVFKQWLSQPTTICPPEGEMLQAAQQRVEAALAKILKNIKMGK